MTAPILREWQKINLGKTPLEQHDAIKARLLAAGWRLRPDGTGAEGRVSVPTYFDVTPPSGQEIGCAGAYPFVRVRSYAGKITVQPYLLYTQALPQTIIVTRTESTSIAGAVTIAVTVGGATVSHTGVAANTESQNLYALFVALKASTLAADWDIYYDPQQGTREPVDAIFLVRKTATENVTCTATELYLTCGNYQAANTAVTRPRAEAEVAITTDLASGWVYYLSVTARSFTLGAKTNAAVQPPIFAAFGDHAAAVAAVPPEDPRFTSRFPLIPVELVVGSITTTLPREVYTTHVFNWPTRARRSSAWNIGCEANGWRPRSCWVNSLSDKNGSLASETNFYTFTYPQMDVASALSGNRASAHIHGLATSLLTGYLNDGGSHFCPPILLDGVFAFTGTASEEQVVACADFDLPAAMLTVDIPASGDVTTITGTGLSSLRSSGTVVIGKEIFAYDGNDGSALAVTGRAQGDASSAAAHYAGDPIRQVRYGVKLSGAWLDWGYSES